jgi:hypothetical protein
LICTDTHLAGRLLGEVAGRVSSLYGAEETASDAKQVAPLGAARQATLPCERFSDLAQGLQRGPSLCWRVADPTKNKQLLARVERIEELLRSPDVPGQVRQAEALAVSISQSAPSGIIADLALQVVAALGAMNRFPEVAAYMVTLDTALRRLREALRTSHES